ncbi:MAG: hypothetical protein J6Y42_00830 [Bacilli bacterium]|nr:hypothetical protein [Bacilli bacterium]
MVDHEGLKLETELEIGYINVEIKEKEIEMYRNSYESIKLKEEIDESDIPEEEVKGFIENTISETNSNNDVLLDNILKLGALTYKNYCLEDEKFGLCSLKEEFLKKIEDIENGKYMGTQRDVIDRIKSMDNLD